MFNSFANWVLHKIAFIAVYPEEEWSVVETTFTGDDYAFSVPSSYGKYNMAHLASFLKENYAMTYTSPTKTSVMTVEWEDLQYLKRTFVEGHMGIMAPLAKRSIANMLKWTDTDQDQEVCNSVIGSMLLEAWHYGEEEFNLCREWARSESARLGMLLSIPSWDALNVLRATDYGFGAARRC